jgi:glutaredoxin
MSKEESTIKKIDNNNYCIFYSEECGYSKNALKLLQDRREKFKGYIIEKNYSSKDELLKILRKNAHKNGFDINHTTKPIIFYNNKFIGGYTELLNTPHHIVDQV